MKKLSYKYITYIFCISTILIGCDSFLEIQPTGQVIPSTLADYRALMNTAYSQNLFDKGVTEVRTDIVGIYRDNNTTTPQNSFQDIEIWNDANPGPSTREFEWINYYENIYISNHIIENKNKILEGSTQEINQLAGEAYLMRAYMHFILVNLYGQPYTKENAQSTYAIPLKHDTDLESIPQKNTVEQVYTSILNDIASAKELMTTTHWDTQYAYRFSLNTANALASRVYLYMGQWQQSLNASQLVLEQNNHLENLNDSTSAKLPNHYQSIERITSYEIILNSDYTASLVVTPKFYEQYIDKQDYRKNLFFSVQENGQIISQKTGKLEYKCSFRTGEIFLNAAEAAAHLNNLPLAKNYLLTLLKNRYNNTGYNTKETQISNMSQEELINEILHQRALELIFEGHRWFDLRRSTRPNIQKEINGNTYILLENDARYTLRIPDSAIEANPGLLNN